MYARVADGNIFYLCINIAEGHRSWNEKRTENHTFVLRIKAVGKINSKNDNAAIRPL